MPDRTQGANGWDVGTSFYEAEDFSFASAQTLTRVRFFANTGVGIPGGFSGNFYWAIHSNAGGTPGVVLFSAVSPGTQTFLGTFVDRGFTFTSYQYDFSVGSINLESGTYWIEIHNGAPREFTGSLFWDATVPNSTFGSQRKSFFEGIFVDNNTQLAFQIYGTSQTSAVPEPTTMLLLGTGLAGVALKVRRRRKP